jgi:hypothetical protein
VTGLMLPELAQLLLFSFQEFVEETTVLLHSTNKDVLITHFRDGFTILTEIRDTFYQLLSDYC